MEKTVEYQGKHRMTLDNRKKCSLSGVVDVISFDLNKILLETELGVLEIKGSNLHVNSISVEKGEADIVGEVDSFSYSVAKDYEKKNESFWNRMFK